ncbi:hypothetical protein BS17DRAFT_474450 [Gyrodon lividus]|nr:hypothetical protein BS17DRAFT_474450 [Gyrodon lividus]
MRGFPFASHDFCYHEPRAGSAVWYTCYSVALRSFLYADVLLCKELHQSQAIFEVAGGIAVDSGDGSYGFLSVHFVEYYLVINFNNPPALDYIVWQALLRLFFVLCRSIGVWG